MHPSFVFFDAGPGRMLHYVEPKGVAGIYVPGKNISVYAACFDKTRLIFKAAIAWEIELRQLNRLPHAKSTHRT